MPTTLALDDDVADRFKKAIAKKYPNGYGMIKREVKTAIEERTKKLEESQ